MSVNLLLLWAVLGWVGLVWPPHLPPPPPPPDRRWFTTRLVNMIGSVVGGAVWSWIWPITSTDNIGIAVSATCLGAVIGAALASDFAWLVLWRNRKQA